MSVNNHFYLTLPSSTFNGLYSDNTLAKYTTPLKEFLDFTNDTYEVALVEISAHTYIYNHKIGNRPVVSFRFSSSEKNSIFYDITIPAGFYKNAFSLLTAINESMTNHIMLNFLKIGVTDMITGQYHDISEARSDTDYFMTVKTIDNSDFSLDLFNRITGLQFYGICKDMFEKVYTDYSLYYMTSDNKLTKTLYKNEPQILYIYTDIIEHQFIGNSNSKLLRTIMLPEINNKCFHHEFLNPHYVRVESGVYKTINVYIRDATGKLASFADGELLVKLHFREVRNE